jgi:hypothetical protein
MTPYAMCAAPGDRQLTGVAANLPFRPSAVIQAAQKSGDEYTLLK